MINRIRKAGARTMHAHIHSGDSGVHQAKYTSILSLSSTTSTENGRQVVADGVHVDPHVIPSSRNGVGA